MNGNAPNRSAPITYLLAIVGALLMVLVLVLTMKHYTRPTALGQERAAERLQFLAELRQAEAKILFEYAWQDQVKGLVRMPVSNAMDLVVREYQDPAAARNRMIERVDKATALPPPPPEEPSPFE
jgi:hypothetical protein